MLSIVCHGRNDRYFGDFKWRMETALNRMADSLSSAQSAVELVLCDWGSPQSDQLLSSLRLSDRCLDIMKYVHVDQEVASVCDADSKYSSSHAVNAGVRRSCGRHLLICDSDIFFDKRTTNNLLDAIASGKLSGCDLSQTFFWATRYHIPLEVCDRRPQSDELDAHISDSLQTNQSINTESFGGGTCGHFLTREMWDTCGGLDERLIYAGVNDIDIHRRLLLKYAYGGLMDAPDFKFYHLEHYKNRSPEANELNRKRNDDIYSGHTSINPNGDGWGLRGGAVRVTTTMLIDLLVSKIDNSPMLPYDPAMAAAFSAAEYTSYPTNTSTAYYPFLAKLVNYLKPTNILELGTSRGRSALFMMSALQPGGRLTTVDVGSYLRSDLAAYAWDDRLRIVYGDDRSAEVVAAVPDEIDLLYIDTEHSFGQVAAEWAIYSKKLIDGAIVVVDDISLNDGMRQFWESLPYEKAECAVHHSGFGVFRFRKSVCYG